VAGVRIHRVDLARPRPLAADVAAAAEARGEFQYMATAERFEFANFGSGSDVRQLRVLLQPTGGALIGLRPAWPESDPTGDAQADWRRRLRSLGVEVLEIVALGAHQDGALMATNVNGLWVAAPALETSLGHGYFACSAPIELWRASDADSLCVSLSLVDWREIQRRARSGDLAWLTEGDVRAALGRARPVLGDAAFDGLLLAAIEASPDAPRPKDNEQPRHQLLGDRFLTSCELLDELGPGLDALTAPQAAALRRQAERLVQLLAPSRAAATTAGIDAEARWLRWFAGRPDWPSWLPQRLAQFLPAGEIASLLVEWMRCGPDQLEAEPDHAAATFLAAIQIADTVGRGVHGVDDAVRAHAARLCRGLAAAGRRAAASSEAAASWVDWLTTESTTLQLLAAFVEPALVVNVLEAAVQPPSPSQPMTVLWRSFVAALRLRERVAMVAGIPAVQEAIREQAQRLATRIEAVAEASYADSLLAESQWLQRIAEDVLRLASAAEDAKDAKDVKDVTGSGTVGIAGELGSDVAAVLAVVAVRIEAACRGEGVAAATAADLDLSAGLPHAARSTKAFDYWQSEFAAVSQRMVRAMADREREAADRAASRRREELEAAVSAGLLAHSAWLLHEHAGTEPPAAPRTFIQAARDQQRQPLEAHLLRLIARMWPFVDGHDPDRVRVHAAATAHLRATPLGAVGLESGELEDAVRFQQLSGARPVAAMLHAFDNQLRLDYRSNDRTFSRSIAFHERNPDLDGWQANAAALREAMQRADAKIRSLTGIAPSDPGWDTWLSLQGGVPGSLQELLDLRAQAATSLWANRAFPPPATVPGRAIQQVTVSEVQQCYGGYAAREVVVLADDMSVAEVVRYELPERTYTRRVATPGSPAIDEWRDPELVSAEVKTELDRATDGALLRLLARIVAGRAAAYLEEGRAKGWTEAQLRAEGAALKHWFALPSGDPAVLAAQVEPMRDVAAVLDSQIGPGGWARRLFTLMPPVPPVERLEEVASFPATRSAEGRFDVRFTPDLAYVVGLDADGAPWVYGVAEGNRIVGAEAAALAANTIGVEGFGDAVTWLQAPPDESTFGLRRGVFWRSEHRAVGNLELEPKYYRDERGIVHWNNQLQAFEIVLTGPAGADGKPQQRIVATVSTPLPFHDAGLLLQGQLAWTLSHPRTLRCERQNCTHGTESCWTWQGEPSIELWHLPSGDRLWRAAGCRQLVVLAHLDRAISFHHDPTDPHDKCSVRVWALMPPK
jgi:hypothetical protein